MQSWSLWCSQCSAGSLLFWGRLFLFSSGWSPGTAGQHKKDTENCKTAGLVTANHPKDQCR